MLVLRCALICVAILPVIGDVSTSICQLLDEVRNRALDHRIDDKSLLHIKHSVEILVIFLSSVDDSSIASRAAVILPNLFDLLRYLQTFTSMPPSLCLHLTSSSMLLLSRVMEASDPRTFSPLIRRAYLTAQNIVHQRGPQEMTMLSM